MEKLLLENENIALKDLDNGDYRINTYTPNRHYNGQIIVSKEDIERIFFAMKLNEVK